MHSREKMAWYTLAVVLLVGSVIAAIYLQTGQWQGALPVFGLLGLLGLGALFGTGRKNRLVMDERDYEIERKSSNAGFWVFWLYYVLGWLFLQKYYEINIPKDAFSLWFWLGIVVMFTAQALAMVVLYRSDLSEGRTALEWYRGMSVLQTRGLVGFVWMLVLAVVFSIPFLEVGVGDKPLVAGFSWDALFAAMYLLLRRSMTRFAASDSDRLALTEARKIGDRAILISLVGALAGLVIVWLMPVEVNLLPKIPLILFYAVITGSLGLTLSVALKREGRKTCKDELSSRGATDA